MHNTIDLWKKTKGMSAIEAARYYKAAWKRNKSSGGCASMIADFEKRFPGKSFVATGAQTAAPPISLLAKQLSITEGEVSAGIALAQAIGAKGATEAMKEYISKLSADQKQALMVGLEVPSPSPDTQGSLPTSEVGTCAHRKADGGACRGKPYNGTSFCYAHRGNKGDYSGADIDFDPEELAGLEKQAALTVE